MKSMRSLLRRFAKDRSDVTAIEYGLIAAVTTVGTNLTSQFTTISTTLSP